MTDKTFNQPELNFEQELPHHHYDAMVVACDDSTVTISIHDNDEVVQMSHEDFDAIKNSVDTYRAAARIAHVTLI